MQSSRHGRFSRAAVGGLAALLAAAAALHAQAQGAAAGSPVPSERVQRDADSVYRWILIQADKPRKAKDEAKPAPAVAAPVPVKQAPRTARAEPAADKPRPVPAQPAPAEPVAAAAPAQPASQAAEPAVVPAAAGAEARVAAIAPPPASAPARDVAEAEEDEPLVLLRQVDPAFPAPTMRRLRKGSVRVRFDVRPDGAVDRAEVLKTSHASLNTAATEAVAQWKFQPLRHAQSGVVDLQFDLD
jgi:TonB family protein